MVAGESERLVVIGEIVRPHGVRGEVRVAPLTDDPDRFARVSACVVWDAARDERQPHRIVAARRHGAAVLVALAGCRSVDAASALAGRLIAIRESEALPPGPGRFYPWQLEGCQVVAEDGRDLGQVAGIESGPGQDRWIVQDGPHQHLIPAVPEIVREVDLAARRVVIRPPEGLLDL